MFTAPLEGSLLNLLLVLQNLLENLYVLYQIKACKRDSLWDKEMHFPTTSNRIKLSFKVERNVSERHIFDQIRLNAGVKTSMHIWTDTKLNVESPALFFKMLFDV